MTSVSRDFRVGRVVGRTVEFLRGHAAIFVTFPVLMTFPLLLMGIDGGLHRHTRVPFTDRTPGFQIFFIFFVAFFLAVMAAANAVLQALLAARVLRDAQSGRGALPVTGRPARAAVIGALGFCCVSLGMVLVVPGLFLMAAWSVAVPACVAERLGVADSLERSMELTHGCRLKILLFLAMIFALAGIVGFATRPLVAVLPRDGAPALLYLISGGVMEWAIIPATVMIMAAATAAIYHELRAAKGGVGPAKLAEAFD